jgi:nitrite reductase/ring-hydroxylating ferredoxin subunit
MSPAGGTARRTLSPLEPLVGKIEALAVLDRPGKAVGKAVRRALPFGAAKDAVSGTWLGHALHPLLTDVVIGSFTSATLLDLLGGDDDGRAAERLIAVGIAAYGPTALTGANDYGDSELADDGVRRAGLVHASTNAVALALYGASLVARRRGDTGRGKLLGAAGAAVLGAGGYLGGHLSFVKGMGPDQTVYDPGPTEWTAAADSEQVAEGEPARAIAGETPVLLVRGRDHLFAIHDRCSHRGCSLSDGEVEGDDVVCVCHGSRFSLADGSIRRGPATAPQPAFEVREREGRVEVRARRSDAA